MFITKDMKINNEIPEISKAVNVFEIVKYFHQSFIANCKKIEFQLIHFLKLKDKFIFTLSNIQTKKDIYSICFHCRLL